MATEEAASPFSSLEAAWNELHEAMPPGWFVGTPSFNPRRGAGGEWSLYAFDTTERVKIGKRSREWTAVHPTQEGVIREMARCLREIAAGGVPR
ncbi:MAG: hypothetical protein ABI725_02320 [Chloroflexota bacterium]